MCMDPDLSRGLGPMLLLAGCTSQTSGRKFSGFFLAKVGQNFYPSLLVVHSHRNRYCAPVWGNHIGCHCSGLPMKLRHSLVSFVVVPTYGKWETFDLLKLVNCSYSSNTVFGPSLTKWLCKGPAQRALMARAMT
jgi:hypothetical protein